MKIRRGDLVELTIEKFADKGKSLAKIDGGYVVFVKGAVPGDRVRVKIYKRKRSFAEGVVDEVLEPSPLRTTPRCFYFPTCGGCAWQHVRYSAQLDAKRQSVEEALVYTGGFEDVEVRPPLGEQGSDGNPPYRYRNKMEYSFSTHRWLTPEEIATGQPFDTDFALGLHVPGNFFKVLDLHECHLPDGVAPEIVNWLRDYAKERAWTPWDIRKHHGFLRHLGVRTGERTGDLMVNLVTSTWDPVAMEKLGEDLHAAFPRLTTFICTVNEGVAQTSYGESHVVTGPGVITDRIGELTFEIGPDAFFQTNTRGAEGLYQVAREFAGIQPDERVYDLYCGAGTISLYVARDAEHVVGVEVVEEAIRNANANAERNGIDNATFVCADLKDAFTPEFVQEHGRPDVLIADPPRSGIHKSVVEHIGRLRPERFVYVSCNPQTQARDLSNLHDAYTIEAVQPVDMFPHTPHTESVVLLRAKA